MKIAAIIPARYASTRLPGKPLSDILGKPMIQHVYERVSRARSIDRVFVATDDERIVRAVRAFGGEALLTAASHRSGTDRLAEAVALIDADIVVNPQGDEPLINPDAVDSAVEPLHRDAALPMATLSAAIRDVAEMLSPDVVKVVVDAAGDALYFSRSPIPYSREDGASDRRKAAAIAVSRGLARKHVGLYVYRRAALLRFASLPPSPAEEAERLEQLRALHHGLRIRVVPLDSEPGPSVDTPEDLERVRSFIEAASGRLDGRSMKGEPCPPSTSS
ncbi:MAG: 3-deoxy-manno-octulosonate cytidylyltransferase [Vicinamibacteria bacterium]|nr:3-deoxy-manno-octulosonate cytidylyltransferase [Vicinamibacteria bacterium]